MICLLLALKGWGEEVVELSPLTVEAWHFDQLGTHIPADVRRVEASAIEASGLGTVPDLLEQLAGVRFRGFTGNAVEGQLALRGFGENSGLRVLVLVDGMEYNPPDMGGINWLGLDAGELESIEVIRGGQSVLYGNHAVSGVVKLRTLPPGERASLKGRLEGGSDALYRAGLSGGGRFGWLGLRGGVNYSEWDGYRENASGSSNSRYVAWRLLNREEATWSGRIQSDRYAMVFPGPLTYAQMEENPRQSLNSGNEKSETAEWKASVSGSGQMGPGDWEGQWGFLSRDRDWQLDGTVGENHQQRMTFKPRVRRAFSSGFLQAGIDLVLDRLETLDYLGTDHATMEATGDLKRVTAGGYLFFSHPLTEGVELSGGLRLEEAATDNRYRRFRAEQLLSVLETNRGPVPNPNYKNPPDLDPDLSFDGEIRKRGWAAEISLLKEWDTGLSAWAGWDRVYRYPAIDESASYQGYPLATPLNTDLEAETGNNYEFGVKRHGDNWHIGGTAFILFLEKEILFDEDRRLNVNIGDSRRRGLELDGEWRMETWGLSGRLSWVEARLTESNRGYGDRMPLVPGFEAGVSGWMQVATNWRVRLNWRHLAEQVQGNDFMNTERPIAAYSITSLAVFWEPAHGLSLSLSVDNLFDREHAVTAYNGGFYPGAGRQFRLGASLSY